jgi:hypothetical protein
MNHYMNRMRATAAAVLALGLTMSAGASPSIWFRSVPNMGSGDTLQGSVAGVNAADYRVAVYIRVAGGWWTKPTFTNPLTLIQPDLTWTCTVVTGGSDACASDLTAFLVPSTYSPPQASGQTSLPAELQTNTLAQVTTNRLALHFSGYDWSIKDSCNSSVGPGPNMFSASASNVWVDARGSLHLRITHTNAQWQCAEIVSQRSLGYGTYRFHIDGPVDALDLNAVLGLFTWSDDPAYAHRELDVELSRWSDAMDTNNAQYVVQPWDATGHRVRFQVPAGLTNTTFSFTWTTNEVDFRFDPAWLVTPPVSMPPLFQWTFNQPGVPVPDGENAHLNLWLNNGAAPAAGQPVEVVINRFVFVPEPIPAPIITSVEMLTNAGFRVQAAGQPQLSYVFQASSNLIDWLAVSTNFTAEGPLVVVDTNSPAFLRRFYRLLVPSQ